MDTDKFKEIYNASRNGANDFTRHWANRRFIYSDGVADLADVGCHWLLDVIATEAVTPRIKSPDGTGVVEITVRDNSTCTINLTNADDAPPLWVREIEFTDLPEGKWTFFFNWDGDHAVLILPNEY